MHLIAKEWFKLKKADRPVRPCEIITVSDSLGRKLIHQELALPLDQAHQFATRTPRENAATR